MRILGATAVLALTTGGAVASEERPAVELKDQFGTKHSVAGIEADRVIVIGGDRSSRGTSRQWAKVVNDLLGNRTVTDQSVEIVRLADLRRIPQVLQPLVAEKLRKSYATPILMDWRGDLAGRYAFRSGMTNIAVIDGTGDLLLRLHSGQPSPREIDQVEQALAGPGRKEIDSRDRTLAGPDGTRF